MKAKRPDDEDIRMTTFKEKVIITYTVHKIKGIVLIKIKDRNNYTVQSTQQVIWSRRIEMFVINKDI